MILLRVLWIFILREMAVDTLEQVEEFEFNGAVYTMQDLLSTHDDGVLPTEFRMFPTIQTHLTLKQRLNLNFQRVNMLGL